MSAITFSAINFTGVPDADDKRAAFFAITAYNAQQTAANPAFVPLATTPASSLRTNYLFVLLQSVTSVHNAYVSQSQTPSGMKDVGFTESDLQTIHTNLTNRLVAGESKDSIINDTLA